MQAWKLLFLGNTTWGSLFIKISAITWLLRLAPDTDGTGLLVGLISRLLSGENPGDSSMSLGVWLWLRRSGLGVVIRRNSFSPKVGFLETFCFMHKQEMMLSNVIVMKLHTMNPPAPTSYKRRPLLSDHSVPTYQFTLTSFNFVFNLC